MAAIAFPTFTGKEAGRWAPNGLGNGTHFLPGQADEVCGAVLPTSDAPKRVFKLAVAEELAAFKKGGKIESGLDKADGFIHLSDHTSARVVAKLFFTTATDLRLIEVDATKFQGPVQWVLGKMGDASPSGETLAKAKTTVHYWKLDGCVHVYGDAGVSMDAVVREEPVPLGADGVHVFPPWLDH
mmetsp:Transcript_19445/g.23262  ORF Transcript_19445/g.23262 Transcript_19445/m.23262 type:complete len:184 (-) Transcript_19445:34-585(-)|eukprot:CAMPEP_0197854466 /NCGR_PEP_ID=MMETSP1438-20131217/24731_1 /TAXON_ID=1461541 /ORGANISM="Pterosperma sp., Strain CCMP1384" /LENGTH=183 /DNA_ID=CAMNT_0043469221 /DNA_START=152 /DNA_END=703 /DNA_ORIENTATION=-